MNRLVDVVVFDLDDTLYLERDYVRSGFRAVDAWLASRGILGFFGEAWANFENGLRGKAFDRALEALGVTVDSAYIAQLVNVYRSHDPTLTLLDDATWALDRLRAAGHRLALLTDGYLEMQQRKVQALSLAPRMDAVVYSDALGRAHWKPSPAAYEAVLNALGCAGERCVYVGDNPRKDIVSPRALGWTTVRVIRDGGEHSATADDPLSPPQHTVRSLRELAGIFTSAAPRSTSTLEA